MKKKYVLIPVMPTPNGPLHLGHLAGPFLKMDILARHLREKGHVVAIVSSTDPYETHILPVCKKENKTEKLICNENYKKINNCLESLAIDYDIFINPIEDEYSERLKEITKNVFNKLLKNGKCSYIKEKLHFNKESNDIVVASRLAGICPSCKVTMGGYHCEACGQEVFPEDMVEPYDTENKDDKLIYENVKSLFLEVDLDRAYSDLNKLKVPYSIKKIVEQYIENNGAKIRLSNPGEWGIKLKDIIDTDNKSVVFSYTALICLAILCGEEAQKILEMDHNPLSKESDCIVVGSFGFDNTVPFCLSVPFVAQLTEDFKNFDYYLTNFFYTLNGSKFSTSRRHCIWGDEAISLLDTSADILRLYLCITSPEDEKTNFSTDEFLVFNKKITDFIAYAEVFDNFCDIKYSDLFMNSKFDIYSKKLDSSLSLNSFSLKKAGEIILNWIDDNETKENIKILGFSVLAKSIMPKITNKVKAHYLRRYSHA